jgi:hypothetical protein
VVQEECFNPQEPFSNRRDTLAHPRKIVFEDEDVHE